jgi:chemotaxis protein methyltransferase CheR
LEHEITDENVEVLINDLLNIHGYDFSSYSKASLKRRVTRLYSLDGFSNFNDLRHRVKADPGYFGHFLEEITVNVTEMFRDPLFYKVLREEVLPVLATRPFIRIWHAGCSTGEEVYSMAILLHEANLLEKSLLYATDINPEVLEKLRSGIFSMSQLKQYSENYILSGGQKDFSSYYTAKYDLVKFNEIFRKKLVISTHNLVSDSSFNEFQLILCRNVLIYFQKDLQDKVISLFYQSLEPLGFLALGSKESLNYSPVKEKFKQLENKEKIWRKIH